MKELISALRSALLARQTEHEARAFCVTAMAEIGGRLEAGAFLVPLDEDMPGRLVVGLAIPLESITSQKQGHALLERMLGTYADA